MTPLLAGLLPLAFILAPSLPSLAPSVAHRNSAPELMCTWNEDDEAALLRHMRNSVTTKFGEPGHALAGLDAAYVLIFNCGRADEGVYTLQGAMSRASSSYVLTFESTDDADRFAQLLQAEGFDLATAMRWDVPQLEAFCQAGHFEVSLVPSGSLITPPAKNEFDVDAFNRLDDPDGMVRAKQAPDKYASERALLERLFRQ